MKIRKKIVSKFKDNDDYIKSLKDSLRDQIKLQKIYHGCHK